jgi:hypothetical protein
MRSRLPCWFGGWDKVKLFRVVMVERGPSPAFPFELGVACLSQLKNMTAGRK